jgi:hypothetical protein
MAKTATDLASAKATIEWLEAEQLHQDQQAEADRRQRELDYYTNLAELAPDKLRARRHQAHQDLQQAQLTGTLQDIFAGFCTVTALDAEAAALAGHLSYLDQIDPLPDRWIDGIGGVPRKRNFGLSPLCVDASGNDWRFDDLVANSITMRTQKGRNDRDTELLAAEQKAVRGPRTPKTDLPKPEPAHPTSAAEQ